MTVHDDGGSQVVITGSATVTDLPVSGSTKSFTAVEGQNTGQFVLATFVDPNSLATLSDVNASLAIGGWGDGTPTTAGVQLTVQQTGVIPLDSATHPGDPTFEVLGSHTYAEETPPGLPDTLSVVITTLGGVTTALTGAGVTVLDAPLTGSAGNVITGVEGSSTGTVRLGTFVDGNQAAKAADYTAGGGSVVVNWGDGSAPQTLSAGNLTATGSPDGVQWAISAAHTYTEEGTYAYTVTVTDDGGSVTTVAGAASVADAPLIAGAATILMPHTGVAIPGSTVVATFNDANTFATTSDFTGVVDWGDGSPQSTGAVVATATPGVFDVEAGHTFANPGAYTTRVTVHDDGGAGVVIAGAAMVTTPTPPTPTNVVAHAVLTPVDTIIAGGNTGTIAVATFTDAHPEALSHYTASITWGDGHTTSGAITFSSGVFTVKGSDGYALPGTYSPIVTIRKDALTPQSVTDTDRVVVKDVTAHIATAVSNAFTGLEGRTVSPIVGLFTSVNTADPASDFSATINWGDGTASSVGTIVSTGGGNFHIVGSHLYRQESANYAVTVTLKDVFGETVTLNSRGKVNDAPLELPAGTSFSVSSGSTFTDKVIGSFQDDDAANTNPANYAGTINWGDGSTSAAKVVFTGATADVGSHWNVEGTHNYATKKTYTVTISLDDIDSPGDVILITSTITAT